MIVDADKAIVKQRRRALLLHIAGPDVQDIFATLPDTGEVTDYKKAVDALNLYFIPKVDTTHPRHCFRKLSQAPGETVRQFAATVDCGDLQKTVIIEKKQTTKYVMKFCADVQVLILRES